MCVVIHAQVSMTISTVANVIQHDHVVNIANEAIHERKVLDDNYNTSE